MRRSPCSGGRRLAVFVLSQLLGDIQVAEATATRVVIVDPPYYLLGGFFACVGAVLLFRLSRLRSEQFDLPSWAVAGSLFLFGVLLLASTTKIQFSRSPALLTIERSYFGVRVQRKEVSLTNLAEAIVQEYGAEAVRRLTLLRHGASDIPLTIYSDRGGLVTAMNAINQFLASVPQPLP